MTVEAVHTTRVVNVRKEACDRYIGRDLRGYFARLKWSTRKNIPRKTDLDDWMWGNPFTVESYGHGRAIELYDELMRVRLGRMLATKAQRPVGREWLAEIEGNRDAGLDPGEAAVRRIEFWRRELKKLKGKALGCWCKPADCHGDVLVRLVGEVWP